MTIWGGFGGENVEDLGKISSTMEKNSYHSILVHHAVPFGIRNIDQGFIFQHQNDPRHA